MLKTFYKLLNVESGEETPVLLLLGNGFFMGIFFATFKIVSEALFLSTLGKHLALALFISALLGVISTSIFATLQNKMNFSTLTVINLILIFIFLGTVKFALDYADAIHYKKIVFAIFVMLQPIMSVTLLSFWGIFGRIFDLRQSKRIIGGVDSGQLLAAIITSFAVSILNQYIRNSDFLLISMVAVVFSGIFLLVIIKKYDLDEHSVKNAGSRKINTKITRIFKNRYVVLLSFFLFLSMVSFTFVAFSFLSVTEIYYPTEEQLLSFLGIFNGSIMILSLLLQTFVNERLIAVYGLKTALLVLPIVLGIFTVASIIAGNIFGYSGETSAFIWFFLFVALSKLFTESLKEALETPSFKLFFMPLDIKIRFDIQAKVEGVVNEFSRFIGGLLVLVLGYFAFFELIHYSYILVFIIIIWILVTGKLYAEYRINVKKKLQGHKDDKEIKQRQNIIIEKEASKMLRDPNASKVIFGLKLMEKLNPLHLRTAVNKLISSRNKPVKKFALDKMNEQKSSFTFSSNKVFSLNKNNNANLADWLNKQSNSKVISNQEIARLVRSEDIEDRKYMANLFPSIISDENVYYLLELMNDYEYAVKSAALIAAGKCRKKETYYSLIENLSSSKYSDKAINAFIEIGEEGFSALENAFYKAGQELKVLLRIIIIYGRIGGKAVDMLWSKIDFPDKKVVVQVLESLGECGFTAKGNQVTRIKFTIENDINNIALNLKLLEAIPSIENTKNLREALIHDNMHSLDHIFMLLSMIYDPHSIQLVHENLKTDTNEGATYAIELLDVFLSDDLKDKIIFLLDDIAKDHKINKLEAYYPQVDFTFEEALKTIINRDINLISRWTKSCAIHYIGKEKLGAYDQDLLANLFHPDLLIRETTACVLYQLDPDLYHQHVPRIEVNVRKELDALILAEANNPDRKLYNTEFRFNKIVFLHRLKVFEHVSGINLANTVDLSEELIMKAGDTFYLDEKMNQYFYMVYRGEVELLKNNVPLKKLEDGDFVGELIYFGPRNMFQIQSTQDTMLIIVEKERWYDLMMNQSEFALGILNNIDQVGQKAEESDEMKILS